MVFCIIWFIASVITAYGASRYYMREDGSITLLQIVGFFVMNILPPIAFIGTFIVLWSLLDKIRFTSKDNA